jgi:predicted enzyme related to lactoylglutathione lyase
MGGAVRSGHAQGDLGYASLWVPDVQRAAAFFAHVLGWSYYGHGPEHRMVEGAEPHHGIVELSALPAGLWDAWPRHATLFTSHAVANVDAAVERIRAAGGQTGQPRDESYGRACDCLDDQGMPFAIHQDIHGTPHAPSPSHGQIAYLTFEVPDSARARAFFGTVFGWSFTPGHVPDGWQIEGMTPMGGISGGHTEPTIVPMYAVDDIAGAVARVREAGGTAMDPQRQPYGSMSFCADDQGTRFYLGELG